MDPNEQPDWPRPARFKTKMDGRGGLVRVTLIGEPHDGRELFIDEKELPVEIYTAAQKFEFQWWRPEVKASMDATELGGDPDAPPIRYVLRVPDDTREPVFVSDTKAR